MQKLAVDACLLEVFGILHVEIGCRYMSVGSIRDPTCRNWLQLHVCWKYSGSYMQKLAVDACLLEVFGILHVEISYSCMSVGSIWLSTCKDGCKPHVSQKSLKLHMWRWPKAACQSEILGITHVEIAKSCMASQADILNPLCTPVRTRKCIFLSARVASSRSVFCVIGKLFHASA